MNKTKIIATITPNLQSEESLKKLIVSGMNVARLDLAHTSYEFCMDISNKIKKLNKHLKTEVAIMLDTNGPVMNVGRIASFTTKLTKGDKIRIYMDDILGDETKFSVNYPKLIDDVKYGSRIVINNGKVELNIIDKELNYLLCEVVKEGFISQNDNINIPKIDLKIPFLNRRDRDAIIFADKIGADFLALSYVKTAEDILKVNDLLIEIGNDHLNLIAKIEKEEAIKNIDEIIRVSDGVIIARGDLGSEVPFEKIPSIQKNIIQKCHMSGKPSLISAEFLTSMEREEKPSRAEVSDVAGAILDSTDGIILHMFDAKASAVIDTVVMLERIMESAEQEMNYLDFLNILEKQGTKDTTTSIVRSVIECANILNVKAIIAPTMSGYTAMKMSRFRPKCPIIALSPNENTVKSLALYFAVKSVHVNELKTLDEIMDVSKDVVQNYLDIKPGDKIIITGGYPFKRVKHTNFMKIEEL